MNDAWIPISKNFRYLIPDQKGKFSRLEAAFQLQIYFNETKEVSIAGYASLFGWSRDKVRKFLEDMGIEIIYPGDTKSKQNQRGIIKKTDQKTDNLQIKKQISFIDINNLPKEKNRSKNRKPTDQPVANYKNNNNKEIYKESAHEKQRHLDFVLLLPAEFLALQKKLGADSLNYWINALNTHIGKFGKDKYKSHYYTILSWINKEEKENKKQNNECDNDEEKRINNALADYRESKDLGAGKTPKEDAGLKAYLAKQYNVSTEDIR